MPFAQEHAGFVSVAKTIILVGGVIAVLWGGGKWVYDMTALIATKAYHEADQTEFEKDYSGQLDNIEEGVVVQRILNVIDAICANPSRALDEILFNQLSRYRKITGRTFGGGACPGEARRIDLPALP